ncbi:hypothetical protein [Halomonas sp. H5]|uniref:hypothetical protein n=1 Tax=Halomonas sp. H5 TaxID=3423910 RepID=UPI003D35B296
MTRKMNPPGGIGGHVHPSKRAEYRRLVVELAAKNRELKAERLRCEEHRAALRALVRDCEGVACPKTRAAGQALANAPADQMSSPLFAFTDALQARALTPGGDAEAQAINQLSVRTMQLIEAMREAAVQASAASEEAAQLRAQAQRLMGPSGNHPGGLH